MRNLKTAKSMKQGNNVSIIVTIYNGEKYIAGFIEQIERQSILPYEVIIINDCSSDNSASIIQQLMTTRAYIKYHANEKNLGQGYARNKGLQIATGNFIMFIDVDDSFRFDYIERMLETINRNNADIAYCNSVWQYPEREEFHDAFKAFPGTKYQLLSGREALDNYFNLFKSDLWIPTEPWGKIIRKSFLDANNIEVCSVLFEDVIMNFHELLMADRVAISGEYLYLYNRKNLSSAIISRKKAYIREIYRVPEKINEFLVERDLMHEYRDYALRIFFRFIRDVYDHFARGERFPDELRCAIEKYLLHLPSTDFSGNEEYIMTQLRGFRNNLKRYAMSREEYLFYLPFKKFIAEQTGGNLQKPVTLMELLQIKDEHLPAYNMASSHLAFRQLKKPSLPMRALGKIFISYYQKRLIQKSGAFDEEYYRHEYPNSCKGDQIAHYVRTGWQAGMNPAPWFNTNRYLELHPDIKRAGINPFVHYILYGRIEGRKL